jgi:hypothetical protein
MHLRYIHFLSNAISVAEKTVAANSDTTSDRLMLERRFLVYAIWAKISQIIIYILIVSADNGKMLANEQPDITI